MSYNVLQGSYKTSSDTIDFESISVGRFKITQNGVYVGNKQVIDRYGNLLGLNAVSNQISNITTYGQFTGLRQTAPSATLDVAGTGNFLGSVSCASTLSALRLQATTGSVSSLVCSTISAGTYLGINPTFVGSGSSLVLNNTVGTHLTLINPSGGGTNSFASIDFDGYNSPLPTNGAAMSLRFMDDYNFGGILSVRCKIGGAASNSQTEQYRFAGGNLVTNNSASAGSTSFIGSVTNSLSLLTYPKSAGGGLSVDSTGLLNISQWGTASVQVGTYSFGTANTSNTYVNQYGTWTYSASSNGPFSVGANGAVQLSFWNSSNVYSTLTGAYQGTNSTTLSNGSVTSGEWWQVQTTIPYYVQAANITFYVGCLPASYILAACTDGISWVSLGGSNNPIGTAQSSWTTTLTLPGNTLYSYLRIICPKSGLGYSVLGGYGPSVGIGSSGGNIAFSGQPVLPLPPISPTNAISIRSPNVGVGNSSPQFPLDVAGYVRSSGSHIIGNGQTALNGASPAGLIMTSTNQGNMSAPHVAVYTNNSTYPTFQQLNWQTDNVCLGFDMYYDNNFRSSGTVTAYQIYKVNGQLRFNVAPPAGAGGIVNTTTAMCVASNGSIGVNTTNPTYQLDVNGQGRFVSNGANQVYLVNTSTANQQDACEIGFDRSAGLSTARSAIGVGAGGRNAYWWVNGGDRITIDPNGQVGINIQAPQYTLHVNGNFKTSFLYANGGSLSGLYNFGQNDNNGFTWGPNTNSKICDNGDLRIATDDNIHFYTGLTSSTYGYEAMTIASSGRVGIGNTTNPAYGLDVAGTFQVQAGGFFQFNYGYTRLYRNDGNAGDGLFDFYSDVGGAQTNIARLSCNGNWNTKTGSYNTLSDRRKKKNICDARRYLDSLCKLRVRKYSWQDSDDGDKPTQLGFVADEIEEVMPGLIDTIEVGEIKDFKCVKSSILVPMLVTAVQELQARLQAVERLLPQASA